MSYISIKENMKEEITPKTIRLKNSVIDDIYFEADKENRNFSNMAETLIIEALRARNTNG